MIEKKRELKNKCPICNKSRIYKSLSGYNRAVKLNLSCKSCSNSIKKGGQGNVSPKNGIKKCIDCNIEKEIINFHYYKNSNRYQSTCKKCSLKRSSEYHVKIYRYKKYNLNKDQYLNMLKNQKNKCLGCNKEKNLYIDHDHITNKVRGLLCRECNSAFGLLEENINTLKNLIKYAKKYR